MFSGLFYLLDSIEGFKRQFSMSDTTIQHTQVLSPPIAIQMLTWDLLCSFAVHERVPPFALYIIALVGMSV
jgi:hypothetical protein